jgi:exopolysaccharide biosynthesis protein
MIKNTGKAPALLLALMFLTIPCISSAEVETVLPVRELPVNLSGGMEPNPAGFTADSYSDDSITVRMETRNEGSVVYRVAWIEVKHASQLRTAAAGSLASSKVALPSSMAQKNHAIVAINGDYFSNNPAKTSFEYRMTQKIRTKTNRTKDLLIIDEAGDFHLCVQSSGELLDEFAKSGHTIVNAFTFGPALVIEGMPQDITSEYGYNPSGKEPRMAIGQMGPLSYVLLLAEGRLENSQGVTLQEFADYIHGLGCLQAFNLDGGNSATMIFNNRYYQTKSKGSERAQSDIIYFASAVDPSEWK